MRWMFLVLPLLCWAGAASAASSEVLIVVADDRELASAAVSAISQQYQGPVALAPTRWNGSVQPGSARLQISRVDARRWRLSLIGPAASVAREIALPSGARQLDLAEAFALAVPGLVTKLDAKSRAARARELEAIVQERTPAKPPEGMLECPRMTAPPPESKPAPVAAGQSAGSEKSAPVSGGRPAPPEGTAGTVVAPPVDKPHGSSWSVGVAPGLFLSERTSAGYGAEVTASRTIGSGWLARVSAGGYSTHAWQYQVGMIPFDAFLGAQADWGRFAAEIGLGGQVTLATASVGTSVSFSPAAELMLGVRVMDGWFAGIRAIGAYTPENTDINASSEQNSIFLSQGQMRAGIVVQWEPR